MENNSLRTLLIDIVQGVATLYMMLVMIRVLMTWLRQDVLAQYHKFFAFVASLTDPFLNFIRRIFPFAIGRVDFSPVLALIIVELVKYGIIRLFILLIK